jgi:hypothetical protein
MTLVSSQTIRAKRYPGSDSLFDAIYLGPGTPLEAGPYHTGGVSVPTVLPQPRGRIRYTSGGVETLDVPYEWIVTDDDGTGGGATR